MLTVWNQKQYQRTEDTVQYASNEFSRIEQCIVQSWRIQFWIINAVLIRYVLLENAQRQHRQRCVEQIVHRNVHWIEHRLHKKTKKWVNIKKKYYYIYLCTETAEKGIPKMAQCERKILIEEVSQKFAHSIVRPTTVYQQQSFQVPKLGDRIIAGQHRLHPFLTGNADSNVCGYI